MPDHGVLQRFVDSLFAEKDRVVRLDAVVRAETMDLPPDLLDVVNLLPPGSYTRQRLCDQINSSLIGHGWGRLYGTVE